MSASAQISIGQPPRERRLESIIKVVIRPDGIAILAIADPANGHNTITPAFGGELTAALDLVASDPTVRAVVIRSGKKASFVVGANIDFVRSLRFARDAEEASREIVRRFDRLGKLRPRRRRRAKPVVAFVHGPALGGGFELALACTATVATDDPTTVFGLPEVKLGLIPAGGGLFRVAERAGLSTALDLGLSGRTLRASQALDLGLVDEVVTPSNGLEAAIALADRLAKSTKALRAVRKRRRAKGLRRVTQIVLEKNPIGRLALFHHVRRANLERTRGNYPAPERIIDLLERFGTWGFAAAARVAPRVFGELVLDDTARRLMELFAARLALKKENGLEPNEDVAALVVDRVGVIGAGLMGGGIATLSARAGCRVAVKETDAAAVERGLRYVGELVDAWRRQGVIASSSAEAAIARVAGTTHSSSFDDAQFVFEAVVEDLDAKRAALAELATVLSPSCFVASCTSAIPIAQMATAFSRPERVVGMHYTMPVHDAPLLEVVRAPNADPSAIATAVALGKRQGKNVIVVRDGVGFYTTRIRVPLLNEAVHLLTEGVPIDAIDAAMRDWGFRLGPFHLLDEIGLDVALHAAKLAHTTFGVRMRVPLALSTLSADGRKGRKNAHGFYLHGTAAPRTSTVDETVYRVLGIAPRRERIPTEDIVLRCGLAMMNEAFRCHDEGIVRSARDGDLGATIGVGFPSFRGGPFRYVDALGSTEVLRRMRSLEQRFGERFEPAPLLVDIARRGRRFYG